jgi:hypothetical protein
MDPRLQIRRLIIAVFGTMVLILASYRGLSSMRFVSDFNLNRRSTIEVALRVSKTWGEIL